MDKVFPEDLNGIMHLGHEMIDSVNSEGEDFEDLFAL
jgi:hypothetical protein